MLERLLEASGLQKGREYETQIALKDDDGGRPRPDVIVHLPEGRDLIIDAKVSLTAYERYCAASDEHERGMQLGAHLASMRTHVKELAERGYSDLPGVNSLEFVLMFVPVEAAFIEAVHHDDELHAFALRETGRDRDRRRPCWRRCARSRSLWRFDDRNRNAFEIAERAGTAVRQVRRLRRRHRGSDAASSMRRATRSVRRRGKLVERTRQPACGQVEKLRELGARAGKIVAGRR